MNNNKTQTTEDQTNSTEALSPAFKARLANLLNRLKEQLFRFREFQQRQQLFLGMQKGSNNISMIKNN